MVFVYGGGGDGTVLVVASLFNLAQLMRLMVLIFYFIFKQTEATAQNIFVNQTKQNKW